MQIYRKKAAHLVKRAILKISISTYVHPVYKLNTLYAHSNLSSVRFYINKMFSREYFIHTLSIIRVLDRARRCKSAVDR